MAVSAVNSLSLRIYYNPYKSVASGSTRKNASIGTMSFADASALRNAVRRLQDFNFEADSTEALTQEKLQAFTDTVNNTLASATKYGTTDHSVKNAATKIKDLNKEVASELKKIGITVEKDGTLSLYENASKLYSNKKINSFFSKDSKYLNDLYNAAKRITRKVDVRI